MGSLNHGVFGGFSGKVGNVVGSSWKDIQYIRSRPAKYNDAKTKSQVKQRGRFTLAMGSLRTFTPFLRVGFQSQASGRMTAFNAAMSYNMKNAVKGEKENVALDYVSVRVARGDLEGATGIRAEVVDGALHVNWDSTASGNARPDDVAMVLAYNPAKELSVYDLNGGKRAASTAVLPLPSDWEGDALHAYLVFKSADGADVSESVYLGGADNELIVSKITRAKTGNKRVFRNLGVLLAFLMIFSFVSYAQKPPIPIPLELFAGHEGIYSQLVVKRPFTPKSRFYYFKLATYSANYENDVAENRRPSIILPTKNSLKITGLSCVGSFEGERLSSDTKRKCSLICERLR